MIRTEATFLEDGSCRLTDPFERTERTWPSVAAWASDWITEWRADDFGNSHEFLQAAIDDAVSGVATALVELAEAAGEDDELLRLIGAGPLEDLMYYSGNGLRVLDEVDRAARRSPAFRAALRYVALGAAVPQPVVLRLKGLVALDADQR